MKENAAISRLHGTDRTGPGPGRGGLDTDTGAAAQAAAALVELIDLHHGRDTWFAVSARGCHSQRVMLPRQVSDGVGALPGVG